MFALPVHLGGLGISNSQALSDSELTSSAKVTQPLVKCTIHQEGTFNADITVCQCQAKTTVVSLKRKLQSTEASELKSILPAEL